MGSSPGAGGDDRPSVADGSAGRPSDGQATTGTVGRVLQWVKGLSLRQLTGGVAALGLALTAPFGGWADAATPALTVAKADQVIHTGPLDITITRVTASTRPGRDFTTATDGQYLLVRGRVRGTTKVTLTDGELRQAVRLRGVGGLQKYALGPFELTADEADLAQPSVYSTDDASTMATVAPELSYDVAWVWQRQGAAAPSSVEIVVNGFTYRQSSLSDVTGWLDPTPLTHLRLPVTVKEPYQDPAP